MRRTCTSRAFVILATIIFSLARGGAAHAAPNVAYRVTDLGTLGGRASFSFDISSSGQIVGTAQYGEPFLLHAFLYDGVMHDLGTLGGTSSDASAINDVGLIVGSSTLRSGIETHAYRYDGTMHDLGTLGGSFSEAFDVNATGHVVGWASNDFEVRRAFFYDGAMHDLATLGGSESMAISINDFGLVVGWSKMAGDSTTHPFLYDGSMHDLGVLGEINGFGDGFAYGINSAGRVVGESTTDSGETHAFLYDGVMRDLGTLGGATSRALAINSRDDVVGQSSPATGPPHAFLYTSGAGMVDLNDLIDPLSGWVLTAGRAINDAGQIVGEGMIGGRTHAYLLTPVPEPHGLALATLALCGLIASGTRAGRRRLSRPLSATTMRKCSAATGMQGRAPKVVRLTVAPDRANELASLAKRTVGLPASTGRLSRPLAAPFLALLVTLVQPTIAVAQQTYFDYNSSGRLTRLWIPPGVDTVRGILIVGNGSGVNITSAANNPIYQRFGEIHRFAVVGTAFWDGFSDLPEIGLWQSHLAALGEASGHPELVHAPWAPIGLSNGGTMSYGFNALRPQKVIAFVANKGCCYNTGFPSEAALQTPGLLIAGEFDTQFRRDSIRRLFDDNRPRGALWAWAEEEKTGHANTDDELFLPFMSEAIRLRYPDGALPSATAGVTLKPLAEENGWLADQTTWRSGLVEVASYADYAGDKSAAGWLPSENLAQLYRAFATYDKPVSIQFPSSRLRLGESLSDQLPLTLSVRINTAAVPDWSKVELFDLGQKIGEVLAAGGSANAAVIPTTLAPGRVHSLTALVTHADGMTISPTHMVTLLTAIPEPCSAALLVGFMSLCGSRQRRRWN